MGAQPILKAMGVAVACGVDGYVSLPAVHSGRRSTATWRKTPAPNPNRSPRNIGGGDNPVIPTGSALNPAAAADNRSATTDRFRSASRHAAASPAGVLCETRATPRIDVSDGIAV
ncbi:hypothetical protein [Halonotius sp. F2-221B]|uniref:hypothetical protein n=1 Tax=Halonotius sp. F2-221B TaxID=2731620 RepID=UPI00398B3631